jgi:hypothetical protein
MLICINAPIIRVSNIRISQKTGGARIFVSVLSDAAVLAVSLHGLEASAIKFL